MTDAFQGFDARLERICRKRAMMEQGYVSNVGKDGLIVFRPTPRTRGFPFRGLMILIVALFGFKGLLLAHLGQQIYDDRVTALSTGSVVEKAGAFVMQSDPVSLVIAQRLRPLVK